MLQKLEPITWLLEIIPVNRVHLYDLARKGVIPTVRIGRRIFVDPERIKEFIDAGGQALPGGWRRRTSETARPTA